MGGVRCCGTTCPCPCIREPLTVILYIAANLQHVDSLLLLPLDGCKEFSAFDHKLVKSKGYPRSVPRLVLGQDALTCVQVSCGVSYSILSFHVTFGPDHGPQSSDTYFDRYMRHPMPSARCLTVSNILGMRPRESAVPAPANPIVLPQKQTKSPKALRPDMAPNMVPEPCRGQGHWTGGRRGIRLGQISSEPRLYLTYEYLMTALLTAWISSTSLSGPTPHRHRKYLVPPVEHSPANPVSQDLGSGENLGRPTYKSRPKL